MSTSLYRAVSQSPILVPLDGSARAESALMIASRLAKSLGSTILLARVCPVVAVPFASSYAPLPPETYQQLLDDERQLARAYLKKQGELLQEQGFAVRTVLAEGDAASALLDICSTETVGLVVMTTHGRSGLARFALGSVADRLVRYSHVPVLLLRSYAAKSAVSTSGEPTESVAWHIDRALVPLDGSFLAESALPMVWELAGSVFHHITLERVVPFSASEQDRASAMGYLEAHAAELRAQLGTKECQVATRIRDGVVPSEKIIDEAEEDRCLVVMATHGWGGMRRMVMGSVTDQVVHTAHVPVLVVHPEQPGETPQAGGQSLVSAGSGRAKS